MKKTLKINVLVFSVILCLIFMVSNSCSWQKKRLYLDAALEAADWIQSSAVSSEDGTLWPAVPDENTTTDSSLYSGNAGIVLFFLEMYYSTGDVQYLYAAQAGADHLLSTLSEEKSTGFYSAYPVLDLLSLKPIKLLRT